MKVNSKLTSLFGGYAGSIGESKVKLHPNQSSTGDSGQGEP